MSDYDEFERFIRHQEFGKILDLAGRLKHQRSRLVSFASPDNNADDATALAMRTPRKKNQRTGNSYEYHDTTFSDHQRIDRGDFVGLRPMSRRGGTRNSYHTQTSIENSADFIRTALVPSLGNNALEGDAGKSSGTVERGAHPITDSLVDETIKSLAEELMYCLQLKKQLNEAAVDSRIVSPSCTETGSQNAPKYPKWQIDIMQEWILEHREHPYPTQTEATQLSRATGLDSSAVLEWMESARRRHMKLVIDRQRKPRDFLDFMFLATDREKQIMSDNPDKTLSFQTNRKSSGDTLTPVALTSTHSHSLSAAQTLRKSNTKCRPRSGIVTEGPRYTYPRPHQSEETVFELMNHPPRHSAYVYQGSDNEAPDYNTHSLSAPYTRTTPRNAEQIFRRGKQLHQLPAHKERDENTVSHLQFEQLQELSPPNWTFSGRDNSNYEREAKLRANEQRLIEQYTPNGVIESPEGSLDGSFDIGEINEDLFDSYYVSPLRYEGETVSLENDNRTEELSQVLHRDNSFNVDDALAETFDDSEKGLLNLIA